MQRNCDIFPVKQGKARNQRLQRFCEAALAAGKHHLQSNKNADLTNGWPCPPDPPVPAVTASCGRWLYPLLDIETYRSLPMLSSHDLEAFEYPGPGGESTKPKD
ncbi:MAG: hypothetical protein KJ622_02775 [Alphaproteobacteria bacterium]|nr:hypothetical protein [Alphaproteobacteria bacterium]